MVRVGHYRIAWRAIDYSEPATSAAVILTIFLTVTAVQSVFDTNRLVVSFVSPLATFENNIRVPGARRRHYRIDDIRSKSPGIETIIGIVATIAQTRLRDATRAHHASFRQDITTNRGKLSLAAPPLTGKSRRAIITEVKMPTTRYTHAVVCRLPQSLKGRQPTLDYDRAKRQHENYVRALRDIGLDVIEMPADERTPWCAFVDDTAFVCNGTAMITKPAEPDRAKEVNRWCPF